MKIALFVIELARAIMWLTCFFEAFWYIFSMFLDFQNYLYTHLKQFIASLLQSWGQIGSF